MGKELYLSIEDISALLGVAVPPGMEGRTFRGVTTLEAAEAEDIAYVTKEKYLSQARATRAGLLILPSHLPPPRAGVIQLPSVMASVIRLLKAFHPDPHHESFVHPTAVLGKDVVLGANVHLGPHVVVEEGTCIGDNSRLEAGCFVGRDSSIGPDCWFSPHVVIMHESQIGARVRIHPGVVIGADGFRLEMIEGRPVKVPQVGRVVIEDDVEIGANSTIDRASLTETRIGARTKIDNLVHLGHNVIVESDCIIVAQVGVGGSTRIGRGTMIAGQSGLKDNITVGAGSRIGGRSGVQNSLPPRSDVMGSPAVPVRDYARFTGFMRRFPTHWEKLKRLVQNVDDDPEERD